MSDLIGDAGPIVTIDGRAISNWESFHSVSRQAFGFFDGYGENMDAWIDCMTDLDAGNGMTEVQVNTGQCLTILVDRASEFRRNQPEIFRSLEECSAFVNWRRIEQAAPPVIALAYYR